MVLPVVLRSTVFAFQNSWFSHAPPASKLGLRERGHALAGTSTDGGWCIGELSPGYVAAVLNYAGCPTEDRPPSLCVILSGTRIM